MAFDLRDAILFKESTVSGFDALATDGAIDRLGSPEEHLPPPSAYPRAVARLAWRRNLLICGGHVLRTGPDAPNRDSAPAEATTAVILL
jgi:hypothetical protein